MPGNDFLATILNRAQGRAPVVERRRPALFEPSKGSAAPGFTEAEDPVVNASVEKAIPADEQVPVVVGAARQPEPVPIARPIARPKEAELPERPVRPINETKTIVTEHTRAEIRTLRETIVEREVERPTAPIRPPAPIVTPAPVPVLAKAPLREDRSEQKPPATAIPVAVSTPPMPERVARPHLSLIQPIAKPTVAAPVRQSVEQAAAPATPDIHVTIGRIEIRATPKSAPANRASQSAGPKLKLEDYLRSRGGGRG